MKRPMFFLACALALFVSLPVLAEDIPPPDYYGLCGIGSFGVEVGAGALIPGTPLIAEYGYGALGPGENSHRLCLVTPVVGANVFLDQKGKACAASLTATLPRTWRWHSAKASIMPCLSAGKDLTVGRQDGWFADVGLQFMLGI